VCIDERGKVIR
jgi:hypothetical protein